MKNYKKIILAAMFLLPVNVFAAGNMIGTDVFADSAGLINVYYQHKLGTKSAVTASYATLNNATFFGATIDLTVLAVNYKSYISNYARGGYWKAGFASADVSVRSGTLSAGASTGGYFIVSGGYEMTLAPNFVLGFEAGLGSTTGAGLFGVNAAYMF